MAENEKLSPYFLDWEDWKNTNPLKVRMANLRLPQTTFASMVGVSTNTVQRWLGGTMPTDENLAAMAKALGVDFMVLKSEWFSWVDARP